MEAGSSSSATSRQTLKGAYDVFLSFRGEDTRKIFVSHLYRALVGRGIHTFRDDEKLERGRPIAPELLKAIEDSKIAIVIFSKSYANSSWCLDELVRIVESDQKKLVIPVFFDVDPCDVRHHKNAVEQALAVAERGAESPEKMKIWKAALTKAASYSGFHLPKIANGDESACIQQIVASVFRALRNRNRSARKDLVGVDWRADKVLAMVREEDSNTVRIIGIYGLGGSGKTTIASEVFNELKSSYNSYCFLTIDHDQKPTDNGLKHLQKVLLSHLLDFKADIGNKDEGINEIKSKLQYKKVLIVLDNVYDKDQLEALAVKKNSFGNGSRVIITTRDFGLFKNEYEKYNIDLLNRNEAMQLFRQHAFEDTHPDECFAELSEEAVAYAGGLPLALKVLGADLCGMSLEDWSSIISRLPRDPNQKLDSIVEESYARLDEAVKKVFLDVTCFFLGMEKVEVIKILDSLDDPRHGLSVLEKKCLLFFKMNVIIVHDVVRDIGRKIARREKPGARLWEVEEVLDVLKGTDDCEAVEAIVLDCRIESPIIEWNQFGISATSFSNTALKINKFRLLHIRNVRWPNGIEYLPSGLRWIWWDYFPLESLPATFEGTKLVALTMQFSRILEPFRGRMFGRLKIMDFSGCRNMKISPHFSLVPCLEEVYLSLCRNLVEVHESFGSHRRLRLADFQGCIKLQTFPEIQGLSSLEQLKLKLTGIRRLPESAINLTGLRKLDLSCCKNFESSPDSAITESFAIAITLKSGCLILPSFSNMTCLDLRNCLLWRFFIPENCLPSLVELKLGNNKLQELVISDKCFSSMKFLDLFMNNFDHFEDDQRSQFSQLELFSSAGSTVSLLRCDPSHQFYNSFNWNAVLGGLKERDSELSIIIPGDEVPECFEYRTKNNQCELILPPIRTGYAENIKGVAICAVDKIFLTLRIEHNCQSFYSYDHTLRRNCGMPPEPRNHLLFHFVPSKYLGCCISTSKQKHGEQICLLHAEVPLQTDPKWGIHLVYEDEADEIHDIRMITRDKGAPYLNVLCGEGTFQGSTSSPSPTRQLDEVLEDIFDSSDADFPAIRGLRLPVMNVELSRTLMVNGQLGMTSCPAQRTL